MSYMNNYMTSSNISVWQTTTIDGKALVYAQTKEGNRLSVLWDKDGNGTVAIDELNDSESDEVWNSLNKELVKVLVWEKAN